MSSEFYVKHEMWRSDLHKQAEETSAYLRGQNAAVVIAVMRVVNGSQFGTYVCGKCALAEAAGHKGGYGRRAIDTAERLGLLQKGYLLYPTRYKYTITELGRAVLAQLDSPAE